MTYIEAINEIDIVLSRAEQAAKLLECYMEHEAERHTSTELIDITLYAIRNVLEEINAAKQASSAC